MKFRKKRLIQLIVLLFIATNFSLVFLDEEEKVDRIAYINEWSEVFQSDLEETVSTPGVLAAMEENPIYLDEESGTFNEFLVEERDYVTVGDPLFSYSVHNYYETEANLLEEATKLESQLTSIETAITTISAYQIPETDTESAPSFEVTNEEIRVEFPQDPIEANLMKEQYLAEKENELSQKTAELALVEAQILELQETGDTITVESPFEGRIKELSHELNNPLITVESTALHAKGELAESVRPLIEQGFPVRVEVAEVAALLEGTVEEVSDSPKEEVSVEGESIYPLHVTFEDPALTEEETLDETDDSEESAEIIDLLPGYHANLTIITDSAEGAATLFERTIFKNRVWKMTVDGRLQEQTVATGIHMDDMLEIVEGVTIGDWVAGGPEGQLRDNATFVTPLKLWEQPWRKLMSPQETNWWDHFVTGIISR
ncbi:efflux RND transporter periplasmic adaptor subunit [Oceanobacillus manasiensis]|uniref:efflux RND transporter periplasmic adaptor subunit n=1 Tax=Oceanobacillus manasiensis TaxID=586413 RepID=UPI0005A7D578|nr:efflux RND transporter periplasmic adaptor subunit [Oceanobacillus manasiensis]